eukprot:gene1359-1700_t
MLCPPFVGEYHPDYLHRARVHLQFQALAAAQPDHPCVVTDASEHTYGEVEAAAAHLALRLTAAGIKAQDFVSVLLPRGFELVVSVLAIWKAGAVYVPLDPDFPEDRLAIYIQDTKASAILSIRALLDKAKVLASQASETRVCLLDEGPLKDFAAYYSQLCGADLAMRTLMVSSISFDAHMIDLSVILTSGGCLVMPKPRGQLEPAYIVRYDMQSVIVVARPSGTQMDLIASKKVNSILLSVPSLAREYVAMMEHQGFPAREAMRVWVLGGETLPLPLVQQMQKIMPNIQLFNFCGPTGVQQQAGRGDRSPGMNWSVAKALKDSNGRAMLAGYCIMDESAKAAVRDHCKRVLLPAMVPGILIAMASFPLLPNGKTDVNSLPEPDWISVAAGKAYMGPANTMEADIQAMWQRVLQFDAEVSVEAEWASVGGTSLKAIALYQLLKQHFNLPGPSAALASANTIKSQAAAVVAMQQESGDEVIPLVPQEWQDNLRPLSAGQLQMYVLSEQIALHYLYNESYAQTLEGPLRVDLVEAAAAAIVDRTSKAASYAECCLWRSLPGTEANLRWEQLIEEFHKAPFDMARPPLMRVLLAVLPGFQRH